MFAGLHVEGCGAIKHVCLACMSFESIISSLELYSF
jgi:hypothetical protein